MALSGRGIDEWMLCPRAVMRKLSMNLSAVEMLT